MRETLPEIAEAAPDLSAPVLPVIEEEAAPAAPTVPAEPTITIDLFCMKKGRAPLVQAFAHVEKLANERTRKLGISEWNRLFAEFVSAPRG
ncbi:MAG: hypothetical protein M3Q55_15320 [Acidobacteriota bacterium]|nr:hypothetical protein [Acidobacteriota bacterium]